MKNIQLFLIVFLFLSACGEKNKQSETAQLDLESVPVSLVDVQELTTTEPIHAAGMVFSTKEARLSFKTGGVIAKIYVDEGDYVKQGQLLARLDLTEIDAQVAQANLGAEKSQRDLERVQRLYKDSVATLEQVQNLTTSLDVAKRNQEIAQFNLRFSEIRATTNGKVLRKIMNDGELAGPGAPVIMINASGNQDWVTRVGVSDRDWVRIKLGDKAQVRLDAYPNQVFQAKVTQKAEGANPQNGSFEIELQIDTQGKAFASGLFAKVEILPDTRIRLKAVPVSALVEGNGNEAFVYTTQDQLQAIRVPVVIAFFNKDYIAIAEGLDSVRQVINGGAPYLTPGSKITVQGIK